MEMGRKASKVGREDWEIASVVCLGVEQIVAAPLEIVRFEEERKVLVGAHNAAVAAAVVAP